MPRLEREGATFNLLTVVSFKPRRILTMNRGSKCNARRADAHGQQAPTAQHARIYLGYKGRLLPHTGQEGAGAGGDEQKQIKASCFLRQLRPLAPESLSVCLWAPLLNPPPSLPQHVDEGLGSPRQTLWPRHLISWAWTGLCQRLVQSPQVHLPFPDLHLSLIWF